MKFSSGQILQTVDLAYEAPPHDGWFSQPAVQGRYQVDHPSSGFVLCPEIAGEVPAQGSGLTHVMNWYRRPSPGIDRQMLSLPGALHAGQACILDQQGRWFAESTTHEGRAARGENLERRRDSLQILRDFEIRDQVEEPVIYIGNATGQFGHFLLDLVPRLWAVDQARAAGLRVAAYSASGNLQPFQQQVFAAFGLKPADILLFSAPLKFRQLYLPTPLYRLHRGAHADVLPLYRRIVQHLLPVRAASSSRIYLSRRQWERRRVLRNELEVENLFRSHGFDVINPELLSFAEQLHYAAGAVDIAAPIGSQTYLSLFQQTPGSITVLAPPNFVFPDDAIIAGLSKAQCRFFLGQTAADALSKPRDDDFSVDLKLLSRSLKQWFR